MSDLTFIICLSIPVLIGAIIALINSTSLDSFTEKISKKLIRAKLKNKSKTGYYSRLIARPILWTFTAYFNWTNTIKHAGMKNGLRWCFFIYLSITWLAILLTFAFFAIQLVIVGAILYVIYLLFKGWGVIGSDNENTGGHSTNKSSGYSKNEVETEKNIVGNPGSGERINQKTGEVEKEGLFGYEKTGKRIDPKTGKMQEEGLFGWSDTDTRINQDTGEIQKENLFGYDEAETKIDPKTGVIKEKGLFGWTDTDYRIDPKTGKKQKQGLFGWEDV